MSVPTEARRSGAARFLRVAAAVAIVGGPAGYLLGGALSPSINLSGAETIAAYESAPAVPNGIHLVAFFAASFLLPVGAAALAWLAFPRLPRLATAAGALGVAGWLPFAALTALDELARAMALQPTASDPALLDRFTRGPLMTVFLLVYVVFHLVAYVLFGIALRRAGVLPLWASVAMVASSPVTVAAFVLPGEVGALGMAIGLAGLALLLIGSLLAVPAVLKPRRLGVRTAG